MIVDTATNTAEVVENTASTQGQGAGIAAAQLVLDKGVDGVLTGSVGPNAFNAFQVSGVKLFVGASSRDTAKVVLAKFNKGEYDEATTPSEAPPCGPGQGRGLGHGRGRCRPV